MKDQIVKLQRKWENVKIWLTHHRDISIFCGLAILAIVSQLLTSPSKEGPTPIAFEEETADTYIPEGFSLVPIEVANIESLDAILGDFGVVDLFTVSTPSLPVPQRIAYKIKIMRAPKNPQHFAVLVPFSEVPQIMKHPGPFTVSVLNPKSRGTEFAREKKKTRSRIGFNM